MLYDKGQSWGWGSVCCRIKAGAKGGEVCVVGLMPKLGWRKM